MGQVTQYAYDSLGRLSNVTYPNSNTVLYTYDDDSNVLSVVYGSAKDYYTYDARDRMTNETEVASGTSYSTLYSYDPDSNVISITYPDKSTLNYTYDALERVKTAGSVASFTYTLDNQISSISYDNGVVSTYKYDSRDRTSSITSKSGSTQLLGLNYTYDGDSNVLSISGETFTYDNLSRLNSTSGPWGTISYTYDADGNMLTMKQGSTTTTYSIGDDDRLVSAGSATLTYNNGDLIKEVNGSTTWQYYYDYENRMTGVSKNGVNVENNTYDGDGNRIQTTHGSSSVVYVYDGSNIIYEKNLTSGSSVDHYYSDDLQLGEKYGSTTYYFQTDALGSIRLVTTTSPVSTVFSSDYKPYGVNYGMTESLTIFNFMYTDKPYDQVIGLYYSGARFYSSALSRFITADPSAGTTTDPLNLNKYIYVEDNPETNVDPTGLYLINMQSSSATSSQIGPTIVSTPLVTRSSDRVLEMIQAIQNQDEEAANEEKAPAQQPSNSANGPGFWNWFDKDPYEWAPLLVSIAGDVAGIISPTLDGLFKGITEGIIGTAKNVVEDVQLVSGGIGLLFNIASDFVNHNLSSLPNLLATLAWNLVQSIFEKASFWQKIEILAFGTAQGLVDVGTGGDAAAALALLGTFQLITDVTLSLGEALTTYNRMYPSG